VGGGALSIRALHPPPPPPGLARGPPPPATGGIAASQRRAAGAEEQVSDAESADHRTPTERSFTVLMDALEKASRSLEEIPGYYAVLEKQVFVDGRLLEPEVLDIKVRHEPFSVYLKWRSDQQEVLYVDGENDGRLLVHPTRGLISLRRIWRLPPDSPQAMKKNRHPVTSLGIERLLAMIDDFHQARGYTTQGLECRHYEDEYHDLPVLRVETTFPNPKEGAEYSRSIVTFCRETDLVIGIENYGWTKEGRPGKLLEKYYYRELAIQPVPQKEDFKVDNPTYNFL
jgi:hypothetical protein